MLSKRTTIGFTILALLMIVPSAFAVDSGPAGALGINGGFLVAQTVNFILLAVLLTAFMLNPMKNMLDERSEKIRKGLEDASEAANARRNAEAEAEKILAEARSEAGKVVEEGRQRGEDLQRTMREEAQAEAEKIRQDARDAAETERDAQLAGLRDQVAAISMAVSNRLIGEAMSENKQKELIDNFFTQVPDGAKSFDGGVTVISAMPLSEDEQNRIQGEIQADSVEFRVDPSILGGLVIRGEDNVVDGSVRSQMDEISGRLK